MNMPMNEIRVMHPKQFNRRLIKYIADHAVEYNLLVMTAEVGEVDYKKSYPILKDAFINKLDNLSERDRNNLSGISSIVRYFDKEKGVMRGLLVSFGKVPDRQEYESTFHKGVSDFINGLEANFGDILVRGVSMPIVRLAFLIHSLRSSVQCDLEEFSRQEYAMLDLDSRFFRYSLPGSNTQYKFEINQNTWISKSFHLRVRKPKNQITSREKMEQAFVFYDNATGFNFMEVKGLDLKVNKNASKAKYLKSQLQKDAPVEKNVAKIYDTIAPHEVYWNAILRDLLDAAKIPYEQASFNVDGELRIKNQHAKYMDMTDNWMGMDLDKMLSKSGNTLKYCIDSSESIDPNILESALGNVHGLNKDDSFQEAIPVRFEQAREPSEADIVIGSFDPERDAGWVGARDTETLDWYGTHRRKAIQDNIISTKQFIDYSRLDNKKSISTIMKRVTMECLLKRWASQAKFKYGSTLDKKPGPENESKFIVLSVSKKGVINGGKTSGSNIYAVMYEGQLEKDNLAFHNLSITADIEEERGQIDMDTYLSNRADKLRPADVLLDLLDDIDDRETIGDIRKHCFNNDATYIFEHHEGTITSIWKLSRENLWVMPDLSFQYPEEGTFEEFLCTRINENAFVRKDGLSQIYREFRRSKDPHYQYSLQGRSLYVRRLVGNPNLNTGMQRSIVRRFERCYPKSDITPSDTALILSGLLPDGLTQSKDSGTSQLVFEKIGKLAISDDV